MDKTDLSNRTVWRERESPGMLSPLAAAGTPCRFALPSMRDDLAENLMARCTFPGFQKRDLSAAILGDVDVASSQIFSQIQRIGKLREPVDPADRFGDVSIRTGSEDDNVFPAALAGYEDFVIEGTVEGVTFVFEQAIGADTLAEVVGGGLPVFLWARAGRILGDFLRIDRSCRIAAHQDELVSRRIGMAEVAAFDDPQEQIVGRFLNISDRRAVRSGRCVAASAIDEIHAVDIAAAASGGLSPLDLGRMSGAPRRAIDGLPGEADLVAGAVADLAELPYHW